MTTETPASNGAGEHRGSAPRKPTSEARSGADGAGPETIVAAVDLLAHFWSRPVSDEVASWAEARDLEAETDSRISSDPLREPVRVPGLEEVPDCSTSTNASLSGPAKCRARPMSRSGARTSPSTSAGP